MIKFTKMEGIGNDYIYIYTENEIHNISQLSIEMSDRHFGVGSDGIILISPSKKADFKMDIYNADGSRAEMCGNGIRCAFKYVYDKGLTDKTEIDIETLAGVKHLSLISDGYVSMVKVDMGIPSFNPKDIPVSNFNNCVSIDGISYATVNYELFDKNFCLSLVSMGNPHAVCFIDDVLNFDIEKYGSIISNDERFLNRINVEFISIVSREKINMRVWERGSGETLACGTGACASVCACVLNGLTDRKVRVQLLGGELLIEWALDGHVYMTGPARKIFDGVYNRR